MLAGHVRHYFMLERILLSILVEVWCFIDRHGKYAAPLSTEVIVELTVAMKLLCCVEHDLGRPVAPIMFCSDASTLGYALHFRDVDAGIVGEMLKFRERWRSQAAPSDNLGKIIIAGAWQSADYAAPVTDYDTWFDECGPVSDCVEPFGASYLRRGREGDRKFAFSDTLHLVPRLPDGLNDVRHWMSAMWFANCEARAPP